MYALAGQNGLDAETLLTRLRDPHPQVRRHAVRLAASWGDQSPIADELVAMTGDESLAVRYELAFALGDVTHDKKVEALTQLIRRDPADKWIQTAVQSSLADDAAAAFGQLAGDSEFWTSAGVSFLKSLASQIGTQNRETDVTLAVKSLSELPAEVGPRSLGVISELVKNRHRRGSALLQLAAAGKLKSLDAKIETLIRQSVNRAADAKLSVASRVEAIEAMSLASADQALPTLAKLIDNRQPHELQRAAIVAMGAYQDDRVATVLIKAWSNLSPRLRDVASEVLFARPERITRLFDAVDAGELKTSDVSRARVQLAVKSKNADVAQRAAAFVQQTSTGRRDDVLARYRAALTMAGDVSRGRDAFKQHCSVCHKVEGIGHELGPNLATMKSRGADAILANVIDPNVEVNPQYVNYTVLTDDGNTLSGMITAESATTVTLTRAENAKDTVLRVNIEQLQSSGVSIMPEGLEEKINVQMMADIITYLLQVN